MQIDATARAIESAVATEPLDIPKARLTNAVLGFAGPTRFLSNFWFASVDFDGLVYPTTEHAYQAAKTLSATERNSIRSLPKPWEAKSAGRNIVLRGDWNDVRTAVMLELVRKKFMHPQLRTALHDLGSRQIYEVTTRWNDTTWGVVERHDHFHGANRLGRVLMAVRDEIVREHR